MVNRPPAAFYYTKYYESDPWILCIQFLFVSGCSFYPFQHSLSETQRKGYVRPFPDIHSHTLYINAVHKIKKWKKTSRF